MSDEITPEVEAERAARLAAMGAPLAVVEPIEHVQHDYFGADVSWKFYLPDGVSYIEHKKLTEGERARFQNETNHGIKLDRRTEEAELKTKPGADRHALLKIAVVGWNLKRGGASVPFRPLDIVDTLSKLPPELIDGLEADIRRRNPWMTADVTVEAIDKEIAFLQELREEKLIEEQGKAAS